MLLPNQLPIVAGLVDGAATTAASPVAFSYPEDGSIVRAESVAGRSWATRVNAQARADLRAVSLFGGEVTVGAVVARTQASARTGEESFSGTSVTSLTVLGQSIEPAPDLRVPLADWGHLTLLQQRTARRVHAPRLGDGGRRPARRRSRRPARGHADPRRLCGGFARPHLSRRLAKPAVTRAGEATRAAAPPAVTEPAARPASRRGLGIPPDMARPGTTGPSPLVQIAPEGDEAADRGRLRVPGVRPVGLRRHVRRARARTTGWHHGQDIFAALGAPVLAVADGTVFSVGWNRVGGNRLWLRDRAGNEFYYAHLAAFSPLAVDGGRVQAGDVVGFVGNTGDAETTPYHLHFEIHPSSLLFLGYDGVVNPYPYLRAWQHATDVDFPSAAVWAPTLRATGRAPAAGAILLQSSDISVANGLDPGSLAQAIAPAAGGRSVARELQRSLA